MAFQFKQQFYGFPLSNELWALPESEAIHCIKVLRHSIGDIIRVTDGNGSAVSGEIIQIDKEQVIIKIQTIHPSHEESKYNIVLIFSLLKDRERIEWMIEKAVELGVSAIIPITTERSERKNWNPDRICKIIRSAAKQCWRTRFPSLHPLMDIRSLSQSDLITSINYKFIPTLEIEGHQPLFPTYQQPIQFNPVIIMIGPEGDFTVDEIHTVSEAGFLPVSLGNARLRAETAAIHCLSIIKSVQGF